MTLKHVLPAVTLAATLAVAGCGSSSSSSTSTPATTPATTPASTPAPAPAAGGAAIGMKNIAFAPASITVKVGEKITWTNQEAVDHNVTADSGASFKSADFGQGKTFTYTPTKAGTIAYECTIHPGMKGTVTVR